MQSKTVTLEGQGRGLDPGAGDPLFLEAFAERTRAA